MRRARRPGRVKGVPHVARRMVRRHVEQLKVDSRRSRRRGCDRPESPCRQRCDRSRARSGWPDAAVPAGGAARQTDIDLIGCQVADAGRRLQGLDAGVVSGFQGALDLIHAAAVGRSLVGGQLGQGLDPLGNRTLLAQVGRSPGRQCILVAGRLQSRLSRLFQLVELFQHTTSPSVF